ncbi:hypothetical protein QFC19_004072 [Naganishia cerealis]|uniref:Uncharacterized protein n=1 Tax=Naganishia cerealis TaxID=610337 RepID=A0ACC2VYV1_9TREE|nr:hypothetical protein QFC19_004072 [Naganishia cerealis]
MSFTDDRQVLHHISLKTWQGPSNHSIDSPSKRMRVSAKASIQSQNESASNSDTPDALEESDSESENDNKQDMLAALEAYNRSMLGLGEPATSRSLADVKGKGKASAIDDDDDSEGDFGGDGVDLDAIMSESDDSGEDEEDEEGELYDEDEELDGFAALHPVTEEAVQTVVYADTGANNRAKISKADYKRFMSSKSMKILASDNPALALDGRKRKAQEDGDEEEQSNISLDKSLHSLLMTTLLPGAHEASRPVDKRNQMSSRLLELANVTGLGEGKAKLGESTHKGHAARMRTAIENAKVDRAEKARAQAQAAGSWVKGVGGLGDSASGPRGLTLAQKKRSEKSLDRKDRDRGLAMGIGRFKGGMLTLNAQEIARGSESRSSRPDGGRSRGRGGGRGGRGKKRD